MRTIDEEIVSLRKSASKSLDYEWQREQYQIAEWLEELKELRKIKEDYAKGMQTSYATFMYNKAIDDFKSEVKNLIVDLNVIRFKDIDEIAEQLKERESE